MFYVGLDLGQASDPSAIAVVEVEQRGRNFFVKHLGRFPLGSPYPVIVNQVIGMMKVLEDARLVVDATGVGAPVVDLFRAAGLSPVAVTITGGDKVTLSGASYHVPKRDLVSAVVVALQAGRLKIARSLPDADTLVKELANFKVKIDPKTAHDSYGAWREGQHDDLVLSVALAIWFASRALGLALDAGPEPQGPDARWLRGLEEKTAEDGSLLRGGAVH